MKKCSYCGHENSDEAAECQQCHTAVGAPAKVAPPERRAPREKFLPYFLSYFLVASAVFLFDYIIGQRRGVPAPPHFLILNTTLTTDQLVAKLGQVGVPKEALLGGLAPAPAVIPALVHHFALFAVVLFAFWALTKLFARIFSK